ncbi:hypothetical protein GCM10027063_09250 [Promicromonospora xylanilytica]
MPARVMADSTSLLISVRSSPTCWSSASKICRIGFLSHSGRTDGYASAVAPPTGGQGPTRGRADRPDEYRNGARHSYRPHPPRFDGAMYREVNALPP